MDDDDWEPAPGDHPTWSMEEIESHPMFMTELPKDCEDNDCVRALQEIIYTDDSADGLCRNFREQGNEALGRGFLPEALKFYKMALEQKPVNAVLVSSVHSNIALIYLKQEKYPECVSQCYRAIESNDQNIKAYYRGALGSLKLELFKQGLEFANRGLEIDSQNEGLIALRNQLSGTKPLVTVPSPATQAEPPSVTKPKMKFRWRD